MHPNCDTLEQAIGLARCSELQDYHLSELILLGDVS